MGVIGLWSILDAGARPVRLEALAKKRLAVDASIWIYQFLKAVRDKEGNVLHNAHVVGFFRRICKLLFHGIQPVFVFDGKAPLLKKQTLRNRKVLREGGRIDVAKTAGKILAVQMRKRALEEAERQKQIHDGIAQEEAVPDNPVYFDELELRPAEVRKQRFKKMDQYHLPDLSVDLEHAGSLHDPRIMTHEELQAYAKDFDGGEDMSLYDFSKIDYDSDMFKSLPPADQYSILNAARLRSRLRMGLSTEQLTDMFPDRMAFSRFQIERVKERSDLTNRLMNMNGMNDVGVQRIASERGREYILVKNDTVDGGWSLGVVNSAEQPIVIDKDLQKTVDSDEDPDMEFEDVPIGEDSSGDAFDTVGMTEGDMIKFAMEESRKAQLSSTKPGPDFRPSSRRKDIRTHNARAADSGRENRPLFLKDDSIQEPLPESSASVSMTQPEPSHGNDRARHDVVPGEESDEQHDLRQAIAMSLEPTHTLQATDQDAGGFLPDEDDIQIPVAETPAVASTSTELPPEKFTLPFEKLSFGASLFSRARQTDKSDDLSKTYQMPIPERPLDRLQKAMRSAIDPERIDVEAISDSEVRADHQSVTVDNSFTTAAQPKQPSASVPAWFVEEVERQPQRSISASPETESAPLLRLGETTDIYDLTKDETGVKDHDHRSFISAPSTSHGTKILMSPVSRETGPVAAEVIQQADTVATANVQSEQSKAVEVSSPMQESISDETLERPRLVVPEYPESPEWSEAEDLAEDNDTHIMSKPDSNGSGHISRATYDQDGLPVLNTEESILDEADQTRLMEEEDLMNRMAAEEDEYARFSAELGNKRADNYTNTEYEQDMRALKNQQKKNLRDADEVTQIMVQECQDLLSQFGIPYITAASEAESQCAQLVQLNLVDGIVTDDSDVFLFGGTRVYRNMFNTAKTVECYVLSDLEREFELDREKLINLAHLLGSDYTEGIKKIGPVLALELIAEFGGPQGLEDFRDFVDRVQSGTENEDDRSSTFRKKFRKTAERLVLPDNFPNPLVKEAYLNPEVDNDASNFEWGQPDVDALRSFLMRSCGWRQEYTDSQLLPVIKDMNLKLREGTQRNLTDFFSGSVGAGAGTAKKAVKSARMHNALSSLRGGLPAVGGSSTPTASPKSKKRVKSKRKELQIPDSEAQRANDPAAAQGEMPPPRKIRKRRSKAVVLANEEADD